MSTRTIFRDHRVDAYQLVRRRRRHGRPRGRGSRRIRARLVIIRKDGC